MQPKRLLTSHPRALLALLVLLGTASCDSCEAHSTPATGDTAAPATRPPNVRAELHVRGGASFLSALREQMGRGVAAAAFPRTPGDLLGRLVELPSGLEAHVAADSPLEGILLGQTSDAHRVYAVRVNLESDAAHPLGPEFALGEPLADGVHWLGSGEEPALALAGDVLVVGDTREALTASQAWLATQALTAEREAGAELQLEPGVVARSLHAIASAALDRWVAGARRDLAQERARHDEAPQWADPEQALNLAERKLRALVALLPDVGEVALTLRDEAAGPTFELRVAVAPSSPLAASLASLSAFPTTDLARMPDTATLRLLVASAAPGEDGASALLALVGERIDPEERAALEQLGDALHDGSGPYGLAVGVEDTRSFVAYLGRSESSLELSGARAAVGSAWFGGLLRQVVGCDAGAPGVALEEDALRLERRPVWRAEETRRASAARGGSARRGDASASSRRDGPVMAVLPPVNSGDFKPVGALVACGGAAQRELVLGRSGTARALVLSPSSGQLPGSAARVANGVARAYAAEPRVTDLPAASQRLLSALGGQSVLALLVDIVRLMPSLAGVVRPSTLPVEGAVAPVALTASVEPGALRAKLILAPGAGAELANLALSLSR